MRKKAEINGSPEKTRITVSVDSQSLKKIKKLAIDRDLGYSELISQILKEFAEKHKSET